MKTLLFAILLSSTAHAARFVVEAKYTLTAKEMQNSSMKVEAFAKSKDSYFSKLYIVSGNITQEQVKKLNWAKNVEPTMDLKTMSLLPSENPMRLVEDELFPFQWGLFNQGQTYLKEKDDIHNVPVKGLSGKDIGWKETLTLKSKKRPIVAILDSGVDINHPELQNSLWKNENECGKDSSVDNDKNTLPGDCHGWNFTEAIDADNAKSVEDRDGHGTHVAGIVASANNGKGIVGVAPNALIMPIKVLRDSNSKSEVASSEAFARGIIYAVDSGADVINMSLGWPKSLETQYLLKAVRYALNHNVIIVAAAGNNNSSEPLFPCAYDGVICAGSTTLDGNFAGYSNFGGHVDTIAPGEGILSLYPTVFEPDFFAVPGYEVKSGTSQSSPFVAGLVALLKSQKTDLKIDEVFARLYQAPAVAKTQKHILGGEATWNVFSQEVTTSVVRPILKEVRQIVYKEGASDLALAIPFKNYGLDSQEIKVKVETKAKGVSFDSTELTLSALPQYGAKVLEFPFEVTDASQESNIEIIVTVTEGSSTREFRNNIPVVRDIRMDKNLKKILFSFADRPLGVGAVKDGKLNSNLTTIESVVSSDKHDLFLRRLLKDGEKTKLELIIFQLKNNKYVQVKPILIDDVAALVNFKRVDLDFDGNEDYAIQTVVQKDGKKTFQFSFYKADGSDLWPNFQHVTFNLNILLESLNDMHFMKTKTFLGEVMMPAFFTPGQIPKIDQKITSFDRYDNVIKKRLYYLEAKADKSFTLRSLVTNIWEEALKKELKSKWYETVEVENILPLTAQDAKNGEIRVVVSVGERTKRHIAIHSFSGISSKRGEKLPQLVLQTELIDALYTTSGNGLDITGDVFLNIYDRTRAKLVTTKQQTQLAETNFSHKTETDLIAGHLASFENGKEKISILQTREELVTIFESNGKTQISTRPKLRYSFMTQRLLSEMYSPVTYKREGATAAALYVDSTAVTGNRVYLFEGQQGKLVSSIKNSLLVPSNCRAMNPKFTAEKGAFEFTFLCLENNEFSIRHFEMN